MPEPPRQRDSSLPLIFFVLGSLLNLLALVLLFLNVSRLAQQWLAGTAMAIGGDMFLPLGIFLAGVLCYVIAYAAD